MWTILQCYCCLPTVSFQGIYQSQSQEVIIHRMGNQQLGTNIIMLLLFLWGSQAECLSFHKGLIGSLNKPSYVCHLTGNKLTHQHCVSTPPTPSEERDQQQQWISVYVYPSPSPILVDTAIELSVFSSPVDTTIISPTTIMSLVNKTVASSTVMFLANTTIRYPVDTTKTSSVSAL